MLKNMQETLEMGFDVLNKVYFASALPVPVITIMTSPRTNGHFTTGRTWRAENEYLHEINISAEHLDRPIENIMATLCHEMVHYYCLINGIKDTSQNGRYHNRKFKEEAEKRGLQISYAQGIGYSATEPRDDFKEILKEYGIAKPIDLNRESMKEFKGIDVGGASGNGDSGTGVVNKPKCSTRKYQCPGCGNSFRATKDLNVVCGDCWVQFIKILK
ncbi:MAG: SprT-like domain-containing protein [Lachnospiraceae bacterium]|nr:SprT-like domain-containing protein [Lachnospiraceae bacterium]